MKHLILIVLLSLMTSVMNAQEFENIDPARMRVHDTDIHLLTPLQILEDSLVFMADSMYFSSLDQSRINGSYEFIRLFKQWLKIPGSYQHPCTKLREKIAFLNSPDNNFRIYNWEVVRSPLERRYYGVIQSSQGDVFPLIDVSDQVLRGAEDSIFTNNRWYGCLYYKLIRKELDGQAVYFLLGWNGNSMNSERKVMDVFGFDSKGKPVFGAPLFNIADRGKRKTTNRLLIEYQKGSKVSLHYDDDKKQVVFDHCESQIGDQAKKYTYIPDGTYDGLRWDGQKWQMHENVVEITILKDGEAPVDKAIQR